MARKKYLDENGDETQGIERKCQSQHVQQGGKPFPNHHFLGGGTKNEYRHSNAKNSDESHDHDTQVGNQLLSLGLNIREMPGDGNCLFRALSDQISGNSRNHQEYRRAVVQYMKEFRADFEPFVEDDVPFDKYVQRLSQPGTFAGNDAIVAFSRLHNVSVVIHQLNSPAWVIHPSKDSQEQTGGREIHIFYHNGDHYNSVRRLGDDSENPTNIRLHTQSGSAQTSFPKGSGKKSPPHTACSNASQQSSDCYSGQYQSKRDEDYWVKDSGDVERLVEEVMQQTNYPDASLVRETLVDYNFDMVATIDFIISMSVMMNQHQHHYHPETTSADERTDSNKLNNEKKTCDGNDLLLGTPSVETPVIPPPVMKKGDPSYLTDNSPVRPVVIISPSTEDPLTSESDDGSSSSGSPVEGVISSQENVEKKKQSVRKESKRSNRHKKELKQRERKREADRRRLANANSSTTTNVVEEKENIVVVSHFGTLDI